MHWFIQHSDHDMGQYGKRTRLVVNVNLLATYQGPSFTVEGNLVTWQKWSLRLGFNAREGLVLHQVRGRRSVSAAVLWAVCSAWEDQGRGRSCNAACRKEFCTLLSL